MVIEYKSVPTDKNLLVDFISEYKIFELTLFPKEAFAKEGSFLSGSTVQFLQTVGLPKWCAPHLNFGEFDKGEWLPFLKDWSWAETKYPEDFSHLRVLGSLEHPLCLFPDQSIAMITDSTDQLYVAKNVHTLLYTVTCVSVMIDMAISGEGDEDIVAEKRIPQHYIDRCLDNISELDEKIRSNSFWNSELGSLGIKGPNGMNPPQIP